MCYWRKKTKLEDWHYGSSRLTINFKTYHKAAVVAVQLLSCVQFFVTPGTAACQASLSFTISQSLLRLMSIESVMPSNHLILFLLWFSSYFLPSIFPASGSFLMSWFFSSGGQNIRALASALVLPTNFQGWFSLRSTGQISLQSKRPSRVFSNTAVQKHQFFSTQPSLWSNCHIRTWLLGKKHSFN